MEDEVEPTLEQTPLEQPHEDEIIDLDDVIESHDECQRVKVARLLMGDAWVAEKYQKEPDVLEAELLEKQRLLRERFCGQGNQPCD